MKAMTTKQIHFTVTRYAGFMIPGKTVSLTKASQGATLNAKRRKQSSTKRSNIYRPPTIFHLLYSKIRRLRVPQLVSEKDRTSTSFRHFHLGRFLHLVDHLVERKRFLRSWRCHRYVGCEIGRCLGQCCLACPVLKCVSRRYTKEEWVGLGEGNANLGALDARDILLGGLVARGSLVSGVSRHFEEMDRKKIGSKIVVCR